MTQTLTAYPVVADVPGLIGFLKGVFGAAGKVLMPGLGGGFHAEVQLGDTLLMIGGGGAGTEWRGTPRPMAFHVYVPDTDAVYRKALDGGAASLQEPTNQEWGERTANVRDPWGNHWYIATFQGENYFSEGAPTLQPFLQPEHSQPVIEFLVKAFDAVELGRATGDNGAILHTTLKIGNSAMELADADGAYGPMAGMFYLYVDDADAVYARAVACGAAPVSPPASRPYGDRNGSVRDVAENIWYIATPLVK